MPENGTLNSKVKETSVLDELDAIILQPPTWLVRSGIGVLALFFISFALLTYFIQYPEILEASALVTGVQAPIELPAQQNALIQAILKTDGEEVQQGEAILYLGDQANLEAIQKVLEWIEEYEKDNESLNVLPNNIDLGKLNPAWLAVQVAFENKTDFLEKADPKTEIRQIEKERSFTRKLQKSDRQQNQMAQKELEIIESDFRRNTLLYKEGIISTKDFEASKLSFEGAKKQHEAQRNNIVEKKMKLNQLQKEKGRLSADFQKNIANLDLQLREKVLAFRIGVEAWEEEYLLKSPSAGQLYLMEACQQGSFVKAGTLLAAIVPMQDSLQLVAKLKVPQLGAGLMEKGNKVRIHLLAFAEEDWGLLEGKIEKIDAIALEDEKLGFYHEVQVQLPKGLETSTGKTLPFMPNLQGNAEIITRERRLIHRFLGSLYAAWDRLKRQ